MFTMINTPLLVYASLFAIGKILFFYCAFCAGCLEPCLIHRIQESGKNI